MFWFKKKAQQKVGEFMVESGIVTKKQIREALLLQGDNPDRLIGEILVTQGVLSKEEVVMAMEMYLMRTGAQPQHVDEWLDQEEIDLLMDKISPKQGK